MRGNSAANCFRKFRPRPGRHKCHTVLGNRRLQHQANSKLHSQINKRLQDQEKQRIHPQANHQLQATKKAIQIPSKGYEKMKINAIVCRYNENCCRHNCWFQHPNGKWKNKIEKQIR